MQSTKQCASVTSLLHAVRYGMHTRRQVCSLQVPYIYLDKSHPRLGLHVVVYTVPPLLVVKLSSYAFRDSNATTTRTSEPIILGSFADLPPSRRELVDEVAAPTCREGLWVCYIFWYSFAGKSNKVGRGSSGTILLLCRCYGRNMIPSPCILT